jgi:hypothetical protein
MVLQTTSIISSAVINTCISATLAQNEGNHGVRI